MNNPKILKPQNPKTPIVFFGSSHNVFPIIEVLKNNFGLELVVTTETEEKASIIPFCKSKGIEVVQVKNKEELVSLVNSKLSMVNAQLGVVADFGLIIPKEVLDHFPYGILNVHPSLLPKYRGATPVQSAILNGDEKTGVTIIKLDEKMDHGPIIAQEERQISPDDTAESLYEILFREGASLLSQVIEPYTKGQLMPKEQNHNEATFTKILSREDGFIDFSKLEITRPERSRRGNLKLEIARKIRAFFPWPGVWTRAHISKSEMKLIKFLPFKRIQVEGKKEMGYLDFINGYPNADPKILEFLKMNENS